MNDPRFKQLADILLDHSIRLAAGETVYIEAYDTPDEMVEILIDAVYGRQAVPLVSQKSKSVMRKLLNQCNEKTMKTVGAVELEKLKKSDAYIGIRGSNNLTEYADVPIEKLELYNSHWSGPVHIEYRVPKTKWVVLRWPSPSAAQQAKMSTEAYENFYFETCTMDYKKLSIAMDGLVHLMEKTDSVHITGPGTDLRFSIKGIPVIKCDGDRNIPDGEVFTAPVKDSVNGVICFNTPSLREGSIYSDIRLEFKNGKIISAAADKNDDFNAILNSDEGARYVGEFAIGVNPYITKPMLDTLFDEKISGSVHLTPGNSYKEAPNGNHSKIHWDIVLIQSPEYGGGELYFDDTLVRKDGRFVIDELQALNPENF
jgi:aminopeptidase